MVLNGWSGLILLLSFTFGTERLLTCSAHESYGDRHQDSHNRFDHEDGDYVDPSDMGSYQHNVQRNVNGQRQHGRYSASGTEEEHIRRTVYYSSGRPNSPQRIDREFVSGSVQTNEEGHAGHRPTDFENGDTRDMIVEIVEETRRKSLDFKKPEENVELEFAGIVFLKRIIASLLRQMNVGSYFFGPKEAITIDLQAEISHEDLTTLNKFISSEPNSRSQEFLVNVDSIVSKLFHVVSPVPTIGFYEYFKETFGFGMFYSMKFWLTVFSTFVVFLLTVILLVQTYAARSPVKVILYGIAIFFILSCVWAFANFYESSKAINAARLHQYQAVPKDCNFDNLGYLDTWGYYIRIHLLGYEDRCEQYHKEILMDPFYKNSPVEAISDTFSKLIFHPMEYIGDKMGKFFGGIIGAVPFWLQPILLLLIFIFGFLGTFGFAIRTPFLSIEPVQRVLPQLEGSPLRTQQAYPGNHQQIIERPSASIVRASSKDASTSTDDLEEYIRNSENINEPTPNVKSPWSVYFILLQATSISVWNILIRTLSVLLREVPEEPEDVEINVVVPENDPIVEPVPIIEHDPALNQLEFNLNQHQEPENFMPCLNVHILDEEIWKDVQIPPRRKENGNGSGAYGWVYVEDSLNENVQKSGSVNSSSDSLIFEGGGDGVGFSNHKSRPEQDILFHKDRNAKVSHSGGGDAHIENEKVLENIKSYTDCPSGSSTSSRMLKNRDEKKSV